MAYNYHQQVPFWEFVRAFGQQQNGEGVDHQPEENNFFGPPHGPPPPHPFGAHPPPPPGAPGAPGAFPFGAHPPPPPGAPGAPGAFPFGGFGGFGGPWGSWGPRGGAFGPHGGSGRSRGCPHPCRGGRGRHHRSPSGERETRSRTASPAAEGEQTDGENRDVPSGGEGRERRGGRGFGRRGGHGHGHRGGWGHHARRGPFAGGPGMGAFDLNPLFEALNSHPVGQQPWAQMLRQYVQQYAHQAGLGDLGAQRSGETLVPEDTDAENTFVPPIDVFSTETAYVLHIALPGAKKEDVGVNWDADKGVLNVAGVVYRQGDEEFLKSLSQSERKVGVFERSVKLPPGEEEKEEVDGDAISAKLEDGVLIVTVPKVEKEWTEVKKVDII